MNRSFLFLFLFGVLVFSGCNKNEELAANVSVAKKISTHTVAPKRPLSEKKSELKIDDRAVRRMMQQSDYESALKVINSEMRRNPESVLWQDWKTKAEAKKRRAAEGLQMHSDTLNKKAEEYIRQENYEEAEKMLQKSLQIYPQNQSTQKLSKRVEEKKYALKKSAEIRKQQNICGEKINEETIPFYFFDGFLLSKPIPRQFRQNEALHLIGFSNDDSLSEIVVSLRAEEGERKIYSQKVKAGRFDFWLPLSQSGTFFLSLGTGKKGDIEAEISVHESLECPYGLTSSAPKKLRFSDPRDRRLLSWEDEDNTFFQLTFTQDDREKTLLVADEHSLSLPDSFLDGFHSGSMRVFLRGTQTKRNSVDQISEWSDPTTAEFFLAPAIPDEYDILPINITDAYSAGETLSLSGQTIKSLSKDAWVVDSDENTFPLPLKKEGNSFSARFVATESRPYFFAFLRNDGSLFSVNATYPVDTIPIRESEMDKVFSFLEKRASASEKQKKYFSEKRVSLLAAINRSRALKRISVLSENKALNTVAQTQADEACLKKNFSDFSFSPKLLTTHILQKEMARDPIFFALPTGEVSAVMDFLQRERERDIFREGISEIGLGSCANAKGEEIFVGILGKR